MNGASVETNTRAPWTWRLERAWADGPARWWLWWTAILIALSVTTATGWMAWQARVEAARLQMLLARKQHALPEPTPAPAVPIADFTQGLPPEPPPKVIVEQLQRAVADAGLQLLSVRIESQNATAEQLGRTLFVAELRGPYPGIKQVLKTMLERHARLTLTTLRMRPEAAKAQPMSIGLGMVAASSPASLDTSLTLTLWSAPSISNGSER